MLTTNKGGGSYSHKEMVENGAPVLRSFEEVIDGHLESSVARVTTTRSGADGSTEQRLSGGRTRHRSVHGPRRLGGGASAAADDATTGRRRRRPPRRRRVERRGVGGVPAAAWTCRRRRRRLVGQNAAVRLATSIHRATVISPSARARTDHGGSAL